MTKLKDNISSKHREAKNVLNRPRVGLSLVEVYVENEDDKPFWKRIFNKHKIKTKIFPASRDSLRRGKQEVLKLKDKVGQYLILCVDSDYDFLLQETTKQSKLINSNPHIFQTYTYSIENYQCFAESLEEVVLQATLQDEPELFDYTAFLQDYSSIIYDLFIYSFYNEKSKSQTFSISNFCKTIKLQDINIFEQGKQALESLKLEVQHNIAKLKPLSEEEFENYKKELETLGLTKENVYLFAQGHTVFDNVVCMFLKPIETHLRKEYRKQIFAQDDAIKDKKNRANQYKKDIIDIEKVLSLNTSYATCFLMLKINDDVEKFKNLTNKK